MTKRRWGELRVVVENMPTPEQALAMCEAVVPIMAEILRPYRDEIFRAVAKESEPAQEEGSAA